MFEALSAMKGQALVERAYQGQTYIHTSIIKIYEQLLVVTFVPMFIFEGVLMYIYLERHGVSFIKSMYTSLLANLASLAASLFLLLVEGIMNDLHFGSVFTASYLALTSFAMVFMVETAVIYWIIRKDLGKEATSKAAIISFCINLASHICLLAFLSVI